MSGAKHCSGSWASGGLLAKARQLAGAGMRLNLLVSHAGFRV
jgi:hypothetical protein